jgi:hypothetical protein
MLLLTAIFDRFTTGYDAGALVSKLRDEAEHRGQRHLANSWSMTAQEFEREADVIRERDQPGSAVLTRFSRPSGDRLT